MLKMVEEQCAGKSEEEKAKHGLTILTSQITVVDNTKEPCLQQSLQLLTMGKTPYKKIQQDLSDKYDVIPATFAATRKRKWRNHFLPHQQSHRHGCR